MHSSLASAGDLTVMLLGYRIAFSLDVMVPYLNVRPLNTLKKIVFRVGRPSRRTGATRAHAPTISHRGKDFDL